QLPGGLDVQEENAVPGHQIAAGAPVEGETLIRGIRPLPLENDGTTTGVRIPGGGELLTEVTRQLFAVTAGTVRGHTCCGGNDHEQSVSRMSDLPIRPPISEGGEDEVMQPHIHPVPFARADDGADLCIQFTVA